MDDFCIKTGYRSRPARNAGLKTTDRAQRNVYRFAAGVAQSDASIRTVLDWGCGTGQKLIHFFGHLDTLGVDVDYRERVLLARYPSRRWGVVPVPIDADLVICADVIEHLEDPSDFLRTLAAGRWLHCIISTPERDHCRGRRDMGPPRNKWHAREWNTAEFGRFIEREVGVTPNMRVLGKYNLVAHLTR